MSALIDAIVSHDLKSLARLVKEQPNLVSEPHLGWLPIEWAARTGNVVTHARAIRLLRHESSTRDSRRLLRKCLTLSACNYFGPLEPVKAAHRAWQQVHNGVFCGFDKNEPDFHLDSEQVLDMVVLMKQAGIGTEIELMRLVEDDDPTEFV